MNIKDLKEAKDRLESASKHGFGYFFKNITMIFLLVLVTFIVTNPEMISNPEQFFATFNVKSLWVVLILFLALCGFYQTSRSLAKEQNNDILDSYSARQDGKTVAKEEEHRELVKRRIEIGPQVANSLKDLLINLGASRATVCEMHNGTNNFSGVPFIFLDCVYEEAAPDMDYVSDEFKNFNLGKYPFIANHFNEGTWIGSVEEVEKEDKHLAAKLKFADAAYGAIVVICGTTSPLGFLTVSFKNAEDAPSKTKIIAELNQEAQKISTLLDKKQ